MDYSTSKEQICNDIKQSPIASTNTRALKQMIEDGTATYVDVAEYSKVLGDVASKSIARNIAEDIADEELAAFADECLAPVYRSCQDTMLNACAGVQRLYNQQAGLELNPVDVGRDESRISHIVERFKGDESYDKLKFLTGANVARSITRGAVQDSIKANSKFQSDAGLKVRISRSDGSGCCDWCAGLVGTYDSFDALPSDFWGIHRGCNCVIDYRVGNTRNRIHFDTDASGNLSKVTEEIHEDQELSFEEKKNIINSNEDKIQQLMAKKKEEELKFIMGTPEEQAKAAENVKAINAEIDRLKSENDYYTRNLGLPKNPKERFLAQNVDYSKLPHDVRPSEEGAVSSWTRTDYTQINDFMRTGNKGVRPESIENAKTLQEMLERNVVKDPITVRRGTDHRAMNALFGGDGWQKENYNAEGKIITDKGFMATTPDIKGGFQGGIRMYIDVPPGAKGAYIGNYSAAENEKEFLLQANTPLYVEKIERITDKWGDFEYDVYLKVKV